MSKKYLYLDNSDGVVKDKRDIVIWNLSTKVNVSGEDISPIDVQNWRFGVLLRKYRKENGLTMKDLADRIGIDNAMISRIENQNIFNEKVYKYYLANTDTPIEDLQFILTGMVD